MLRHQKKGPIESILNGSLIRRTISILNIRYVLILNYELLDMHLLDELMHDDRVNA